MPRLTHLECTKCGERLPVDRPQTICPKDGGVLYARYDLEAIRRELTREKLSGRPATMWRYREVLPEADPVTLGEGFARRCSRAVSFRMCSSKTKVKSDRII